MEKELEKLESEIKELRSEISCIQEDIKKIIQICSRMDEHISFVNSTYNIVRKPLSIIINIINRTISSEIDSSLPQIK